MADNQLCGIYYEDGELKGTYTAEGITKLCEGLKGSAVTSLKCDAAAQVFAFVSAPADRKANTFCAHRLDYNKLGPEGGVALAEGLKGNSNLQSLS